MSNSPIIFRWLDRGLSAVVGSAKWLALPIVALLFLQWPLRDIVHCCSREANDIGQIAFALFVAVGITAATRAGAHLSVDSFARSLPAGLRRRIAIAVVILIAIPWALAMAIATGPVALTSLQLLERFPDTSNPGYFLIKLAALLLPVLVLLQAVLDAFSRGGDE